MVTKSQVDYLVRARQLALTGHYPHLTDLHQVLDLDYSDDDDDGCCKLSFQMVMMMMIASCFSDDDDDCKLNFQMMMVIVS